MNNQTLNYTDNNGNTITAERYFISDDPKLENDIPIEPVRSFQTHCECCGAPVDLGAVKCPYCGVAYWFKRGKRREARVYDDTRKREFFIDGIRQMKEVMRTSKNNTAYRMGLKGMLTLENEALSSGVMSINELREFCGLERI